MTAPVVRPGRRRTSIGAKVSAVVAGLVVVLLVSNGVLLAQLSSVSATYDRLLATEVSQAETARKMQVEFKKQVQEWKNILLRGANPQDRKDYTGKFRAEYGTVQRLADQLVSAVDDPQALADLKQFREQHVALQRNYEKALAGFVASDGQAFHTADAFVRGQDRPPTDLLDAVVDRLQADVEARVAVQKVAVADRRQFLLGVGAVGVVVLLALLAVVVTRIVRPVRRLTLAAHQAAQERMPAAVTQIAAMTADAVPPQLDPFTVETSDELADLAAALTTMQESTLRLAVEQRRRERETADMLLNLGRRNQALLARVLSYVTDLERVEKDPDVMAALFRIDHATTRVRRNAASMLVLAGAAPSPTRAQMIPVADIVRASLSEIEDYVRVDLYHVEDAAVLGSAATDLTHLLAELLENATHFSPPTSRISVIGQRISQGYRVRVIDQGIGMTRDELDAANARITQAADGPSDARLLGLYVVGRLAARTDVTVRLEASAGNGITASVVVPPASVVTTHPSDYPPDYPTTHPTGYPVGQTQPAVGALTAAATSSPSNPMTPNGTVSSSAYGSGPAYGSSWPGDDGRGGGRDVGTPTSASMVVDVTPYDTFGGTVGSTVAGTAVPVRVRGSRLSGLGFDEDDEHVAFDEPTTASSERLRAFQLDVDTARRTLDDEPPTTRTNQWTTGQ